MIRGGARKWGIFFWTPVLPEQIGRRRGLDDTAIEALQTDIEATLDDIDDAIATLESMAASTSAA